MRSLLLHLLLLLSHGGHLQVSVVRLRVLAELLDQVSSLHLDLLTGHHRWVLHCQKSVDLRTILRSRLTRLISLESAHPGHIDVKLNIRWYWESSCWARLILLLDLWGKVVELSI